MSYETRLKGLVGGLATPTVHQEGIGNNSSSGNYSSYNGQVYDPTRKLALDGFQAAPHVAPQAQAAQIGATPQINMGAVNAGLGQVAGANLQQQQSRGNEALNLSGLQAAANGTAPSAAAGQLQMGLDAGMRQNLALAASNRGNAASGVLATRGALDANQGLVAQTNGQAATLRAGEQATARDQLTGAITNARTQDIQSGQLGLGAAQVGGNVAVQQAGLQQGTNVANLGAQTQTNLANVASQLQTSNLDQQTKLQYLAQVTGIDASTQQGQLQLQQLLAQTSQNAAQIFNTDLTGEEGRIQSMQFNPNNLLTGVLGAGGGIASAGITASAASGRR